MRRTATMLVAVVAALAVVGCRQETGQRAPNGSHTRTPTIGLLLADDRPLNVAHAGGDLEHPHSTLFAYEESARRGADVLELDVQLTADGVLIVHHDETVDGTTEASGPVVDRTLAQLQALDSAYWWSPCWPCRDRPEREYAYRGIRSGRRPAPSGYTPEDFAVPTFRQVATRFPHLPLDVEIKGGRLVDPLEVARVLARELRELDRLESSVVVSFDSTVVQAFHALAPEVALSPGLQELTAWLLDGTPLAEHYSLIQIPPAWNGVPVLTSDVVARAHAEGLEVWVWAADAEQERESIYREWLRLGVDGVIAGRPTEMAAARGTTSTTRAPTRDLP